MSETTFVRDMHHADPAWCTAAAKKAADRTELETLTFAAGPRPHPFGADAVSQRVGEETFHFVHAEARDAYLKEQPQVDLADLPSEAIREPLKLNGDTPGATQPVRATPAAAAIIAEHGDAPPPAVGADPAPEPSAELANERVPTPANAAG